MKNLKMKLLKFSFILGLGCCLLLLSFQNCETTSQSTSSSASSSSSSESSYADAPFPYDLLFNGLSFSTCPIADPINTDNPIGAQQFFTLRIGGFDFTDYLEGLNLSSLPAELRLKFLRGGVGINQNFLNYVRFKNGGKSTSDLIASTLSGSPFSNVYAVGAFLFYNSLTIPQPTVYLQPLSITFSPALGALGGGNGGGAQILSLAPSMGSYGLARINYFPQASSPAQQGFLASYRYFGTSAVNMSNLRGILSSYQWVGGFSTTPTSGDQVPSFLGPDPSSYRIFGKGLRLSPFNLDSTGSRWGLQPSGGVTVVDLVNGPGQIESSQWTCINLTIVRDQDRKNTDGSFIDNSHLGPQALSGVSPELYARFGCPPPSLASITPSDQLARLQIVRRFLAPELWDVNLNPQAMCAVPKINPLGCYETKNTANTISYSGDCGTPPKNECSATVSICYFSNPST